MAFAEAAAEPILRPYSHPQEAETGLLGGPGIRALKTTRAHYGLSE